MADRRRRPEVRKQRSAPQSVQPWTSDIVWLDEEYARLVSQLRMSRQRIAAHLATVAPAADRPLAEVPAEPAGDLDLFHYMPVPCLLLDGNGVILRANSAAGSLLAADVRLIGDSPMLIFVAAKDRRAWLEHVHRCRHTTGVVATELALRARSGAIIDVELSTRACTDVPGRAHPLLTIVIDLRERRRVADERAHTLWKLRRAQHERDAAHAANVEKDHFLGMLSHELRTPITPVLLATSALKDDPVLRPAVRDTLAMVHRNVTVQARLLDDLFDLTRLRNDKLVLTPTAVDLHAVVHDVVRFLQPEIDAAGLGVSLDLSATRSVEGDPVRLDQVVWNLVRNSLRFTDPGGRIDIATRDRDDGCVELVVADSGVGFDPAERDRLFDAFAQIADGRRRGGLGLGLAIVAGIVQAHHGSVEAWSDGPGQGARFTVALPASDGACEPADASPASIEGSAHAPLTVLLVEDHPDTATALTLVLEQEGYTVHAAGSLADALTRAGEHHVDVLVSDLSLPDGSGIDLMRALRALRPVRGVALTGWGRASDVVATRDAGFEHHLTKPVDLPTLVAAIESLRPPPRTDVARRVRRDPASARRPGRNPP